MVGHRSTGDMLGSVNARQQYGVHTPRDLRISGDRTRSWNSKSPVRPLLLVKFRRRSFGDIFLEGFLPGYVLAIEFLTKPIRRHAGTGSGMNAEANTCPEYLVHGASWKVCS